jgi:hypothetical protein
MSTMPASEQQIVEEIRETALQVSAAQDRVEERDVVAATHHAVERLSGRYREYFDSLSEGDKLKAERTLGRRMADIKRLASLLPRIGTVTSSVSTPDRAAGKSDVGERRITGVSWGAGSRASGAGGSRLRVGGDVEAWCSPCGGLKEHSIVAMVGDEPKQVVCQSCNGRHGYRTTPARKGPEVEATAGTSSGRSSTPQEREAQRKADQKATEMRALQAVGARATDIRDFDPKGRYKAGEIIYHPEYGRGKIETVLRSSLLIRFTLGGLKSVILN